MIELVNMRPTWLDLAHRKPMFRLQSGVHQARLPRHFVAHFVPHFVGFRPCFDKVTDEVEDKVGQEASLMHPCAVQRLALYSSPRAA